MEKEKVKTDGYWVPISKKDFKVAPWKSGKVNTFNEMYHVEF